MMQRSGGVRANAAGTDDVSESGPGGSRSLGARLRRRPSRRVLVFLATAALFAVAVVAYLREPIFSGGYFFPGNASQDWGMLLVKGHYQPTIFRQTDAFFDMGPWLNYNSSRLADGHLALWNPYNGSGVPHIANLQSGFFSPWNIPFYLMPSRIAFILSAALRLWMLGVATYLLLREFRFRWLPAAIGGFAYMFGGNHLLWLNWSMDQSTFMLPFGCWCLAVAARTASPTKRRWCFAGLAAATASSFLAGQVETFAWAFGFTVMFAVAMAISRRTELRSRLVYLGGAASAFTLGVAVSAIQLLPFLQYMTNSYVFQARTSGEASTASQRSFPGYSLAVELYPHLVGSPAYPFSFNTINRFGIGNAWGPSMGALVFLFALIGLTSARHRRRRPMTISLAATVTVATLLEVAGPISNTWAALPLLGTARTSRSVDVMLIGVAMLAALGVEELQRVLGIRRRLAYALLAVVGLSAGLLLAWKNWQWIASLPESTMRQGEHPHDVVVHVVSMSAIAVVGIGVAVALLGVRRRWVQVPVAFAVLVAVGASTLAPWWNFNPTVPAQVMYPQTPAMKKLKLIVGEDRVYNRNYSLAIPDVNLAYRIATEQNYDAIDVEHYRALYETVFGRGTTFRDGGTTGLCEAQLRLFGFTYVLGGSALTSNDSADPAPRGEPTRINDPATAFRMNKLTEVGPAHVPLYYVPQAPMFGLAAQGTTVARGGNAVTQAARCSRKAGSVIIEGPARALPAGAGSANAPSTEGSVRVVHRTPEHINLSVTTKAGSWMVARQTYFPGWQARVDGERTRLWRADSAFQAVRVPAGTHTVRLDYRPRLIPVGAAVSGASVLVLLGWIGWGAWGTPTMAALDRRRSARSSRAATPIPAAGAGPDPENPTD